LDYNSNVIIKKSSQKSEQDSNISSSGHNCPSTIAFFMKPIDFYNSPFPMFHQPVEIGSFSSKNRIERMKNVNKNTQNPTYGVKYLGLSVI
jgi:hypothetical protein